MTGLRLEGKVAIVTGAGTSAAPEAGVGVGRACVLTFGREGAKVAIVDRDERAGRETLAAATDEGIDAILLRGDVASAADCERAVAETVDAFGRVDVLVNNAAVTAMGGVADIDLEDWHRIVDVILNGTMLMSRFCIPVMAARGGGSIVNISSIASMRGHGISAYSAAKGAIESLTVDTAVAYGPAGIRVNTVVVGGIEAPMARRGGVNPRSDRMRRASSPLGIAGTGWDIAKAALFFASDDARWITATSLPVDGGVTATIPLMTFQALAAAAQEPPDPS